jgi:hypothetical protein
VAVATTPLELTDCVAEPSPTEPAPNQVICSVTVLPARAVPSSCCDADPAMIWMYCEPNSGAGPPLLGVPRRRPARGRVIGTPALFERGFFEAAVHDVDVDRVPHGNTAPADRVTPGR